VHDGAGGAADLIFQAKVLGKRFARAGLVNGLGQFPRQLPSSDILEAFDFHD
jgi:hypothetical protein